MKVRDQVLDAAAGSSPLASAGKPLAPSVRRAMEARLGHSFADVRVHSDAQRRGEARALGRAGVRGRAATSCSARGSSRPARRPGGRCSRTSWRTSSSSAGRARATRRRPRPRRTRRAGRRERAVVRAGGPHRAAGRAARPRARATSREAGARRRACATSPPSGAMFEEEQLSFARDRIAATTYSIRRGVAELASVQEAERPPLRTKIHGLERQLADALADNAALLGAPDRRARGARRRGRGRQGRDRSRHGASWATTEPTSSRSRASSRRPRARRSRRRTATRSPGCTAWARRTPGWAR